MPPASRDYNPGIHHVWVNATGNWSYYLDEVDRMTWIRRLVHTVERFDWTCLAFCQMKTHVHGLVDVPNASLPDGMRYLNREYSKDFNARHGRAGYFVRKRYGNRRIRGAVDLLGAYSYVVLNPVVEGLCPSPEDWRWSSFATTVGLSNDFPFVDASLVLADLDGSVTALRDLVAGQLVGKAVRTRHDR